MTEDASNRNPRVHVQPGEEVLAVSDLLFDADQTQQSGYGYRRNRASWFHPSRTADGISGYSDAIPDLLDATRPIAGMIGKSFENVDNTVACEATPMLCNSLILGLRTMRNSLEDCLFTGKELGREPLSAHLCRMQASFLTRSTRIPTPHQRLCRVFSVRDTRLLLIWMGWGGALALTPRRPVEEMVV